ncbi:cellulase (glycosyl hydrolase family 5) [Motilibacter peucedani]|uniref:Cellulase (Glycosyl hydrolase family 5) n=1 Tax=Motilibacter peucedani TaxID=598650 RepID=A0A420XMP2_9ACTN|nr:glycosyl hydrolase [Motilibacter peucedani]RKS72548.1 cellulase (glycosyl hydrolase family 5) [Motilibacter peucedani]
MRRASHVRLLLGLATLLAVLALAPPTGAPQPAALELPVSAPVPRTAFGMNQVDPAAWPSVPVGALRLWDSGTAWPDLEPARGTWDWSRLDAYVDAATAHGAPVLLTLGQSPQWASARPGDPSPYGGTTTPAEPAGASDWTDYVRAVVTRYRGRIEAYETWNEPNLRSFYTGSPQTLAALSSAAAAVVHEVDPRARVVTPGVAWTSPGGPEWFDAFLAAGGASGADVVGFHAYPREGWAPEQLADVAADVRARAVAGGAHLPLWDTETGWGHTSPTDPHPWLVPTADGPGLVARTYLALVAAQVPRVYWYGFTNKAVGLWLTGDDGRTLSGAGTAWAQAARWVAGARPGPYGPDGSGTWRLELGYDDLDGRGERPGRLGAVRRGAGDRTGAHDRAAPPRRLAGGGRPRGGGARDGRAGAARPALRSCSSERSGMTCDTPRLARHGRGTTG